MTKGPDIEETTDIERDELEDDEMFAGARAATANGSG